MYCPWQGEKSSAECSPDQNPEVISAEDPDAHKVSFSLTVFIYTHIYMDEWKYSLFICSLNYQHVLFSGNTASCCFPELRRR